MAEPEKKWSFSSTVSWTLGILALISQILGYSVKDVVESSHLKQPESSASSIQLSDSSKIEVKTMGDYSPAIISQGDASVNYNSLDSTKKKK